MQDYWWKDAVIYAIDVERFSDGNGDGIGDFPGLLSKLDYLADLGVTCIWLLPFYPSTNRDNGYDITDHLRVDSQYGVFEDFLACVRGAGERGIRIIVDLVTHHTSDAHPWFQASRHDPGSPFRDFYYWTDHPPPTPPGKGTIFPGEESGVWTYDELADAFYHHRFYHFQPGLNHSNPRVVAQIEEIIDLWMSFGISGFRVDAASHMIENPLGPHPVDESHSVLRRLYRHVTEGRPETLMMGEVDESHDKLAGFFDGEQLNMMFNFLLNNYLTLALASEEAEPLMRGVGMLPAPPLNGQWANFLRNLDEADLERLSPEERETVEKAFAPEKKMRIYGRGIRRRLAPMMRGDERRLKMAYSLLFSLPGAPVIPYGDEIGMGEDLSQEGRSAVRPPMQWTAGRNGGFSSAQKAKLVRPMVDSGPFAYRKVNVEAQKERPDSLFNFIKTLSRLRLEHPEIGAGHCELMDSGSNAVAALRYQPGEAMLLTLHNLSGRPAETDLVLGDAPPPRFETMIGAEIPPAEGGRLKATLEAYDTRWILVRR
jgi:maltose alpha-D-glucosyltransferase/alpha-amylase